MTESFHNIEDEPFPSFLSGSLGSSRATLGNVTLASNLGVPVAASTVAKIRAGVDNRGSDIQASYLDGGQFSQINLQSSSNGKGMFALSFKDDLDDADDFIAAHRLSDMLVSVRLEEAESTAKDAAPTHEISVQPITPAECSPDHRDEISTGLIMFSHLGSKELLTMKAPNTIPTALEEESDGADSDHFSGSLSSFLANEKLMSLDSMNSDGTDDDIDTLQDEELEQYFNKLVTPAMQRGHVEGQEIPADDLTVNPISASCPSSTEPEKNRNKFLEECNQDDFQMPHVRMAATGMDSCPASDEDTGDELEEARRPSVTRARFLLSSTSRQLVGESNRPSFRPGLEGGSSDDELPAAARIGPASSRIEFRHSAEGQVINSPVTGSGGGGGDGSSGSEEQGNDGGVSTIPLPSGTTLTPCDTVRGLSVMTANNCTQEGDAPLSLMGLELDRSGVPGHSEMGDRVGPVGTGEASSANSALGGSGASPVNWNITLDRQVALDAMDNTDLPTAADRLLDSLYLRNGYRQVTSPDVSSLGYLQGTQNSFHLSQVLPSHSAEEEEAENKDQESHMGPSGDCTLREPSDSNSEVEAGVVSLEAKYLSRSFQGEDSDDCRNHSPEDERLDSQQGANSTHSVVYQNEEGKWVTDLAYYSSFEKEMGVNLPDEVTNQFQCEEFISGSNAIEKIIEDQEEFEKEHQFMQEEQMVAQNSSLGFGDTSWRLPSSHILMRASQVSSEFERSNQSYLRLSLGEFFQQRSEALGCLGSSEEDIRRPSFGYIITSPEKREPFPLIRPSDFSSRTSSLRSETCHLNDRDKTLNAEDLDNTSEKTDEMPENGNRCSEAVRKKDEKDPQMQASQHKMVSDSSPNSLNSSNLMLSISTIASAIANASVSADPAQLATMIMELSKRSKSKAQEAGNASTVSQGQTGLLQADHTGLLEELQKSTSPRELSAFDIEKYLRKAELSGSDSEYSFSPYSFDLLSGPDTSQKSSTPLQHGELPSEVPSQTKEEGRVNKNSTRVCKISSTATRPPACQTDSGGTQKSGIPHPRASGILSSSSQTDRRMSGTVKPCRTEVNSTVRLSTVQPQVCSSLKTDRGVSQGSSPGTAGACSGLASSKDPTGVSQRSSAPDAKLTSGTPGFNLGTVGKHVGFAENSHSSSTKDRDGGSSPMPTATNVEETHCTFRPSTSPLTHSSPSQAFVHKNEGMTSSPTPGSSEAGRRPCKPISPSSVCSSPSLSRLTYVSINDSTCLPTPDKNKGNSSLALSTTIVRASPTPPMDQDVPLVPHGDCVGLPRTLDSCCKMQNLDYRHSSDHDGARSRSECQFHLTNQDPGSEASSNKRYSEPVMRHVTQGDSGYSSNVNLQQQGSADQPSQQLQRAASALPPSFSTADLGYIPISSFRPQGGLLDPTSAVPALLAGHSLFNSQLAQQYLGGNHNIRTFHMGAATSGLCSMPAANPPLTGVQGPVSYSTSSHPTGFLNQAPPQPLALDSALAKPYGQHELGTLGIWTAGGLNDVQVSHVVVPEELKFPNACCVGIASQTTLSIFNPMERWVQVGITVSDLSIDGEKVDSLPYQWLIVKNKTIVGPKSTEEQKVLFVPPKAGVYRCIISVSSWPASAESGVAARAEVFARRVVLIAVAENPTIEVDVDGSGRLDFGDLPAGSIKALPLKLVNMTHATVPIRLVISANAAAWRCFTFSKSSVAVPTEGILQTRSLAHLAAPSVLNHVMHASYGDSVETFLVWVHFHAPERYSPSSGALEPADEYSARVDIELDGPGSSQVIRSVPLRARSGTARVHAPKDMQTFYFMAPLGKSCTQTLPLKNAGNINVQLKLRQSTDSDGCFTVKPEELVLCVGEEQGIDVSFHAQGTRKYRETMLTILVLPSGPQYEVILKGEVAPEDPGKRVPSVKASSITSLKGGEVPPILSNKQFVAWGGVTLGRAVQQKLVLRNNSPNSMQHLHLLIRGQDQDCFQLQSTFGPEERLTRHREISMKPKEDVAVHLLFAPTRVACMLAKLELKQSGVCSSQPGVKFTIPLSGYGGTSNIILEDVRKLSDNYVITLGGVAAGRVSKVCLVMRNTGSRSAFIKAVAYADLHTRKRMDSSVISLSPPQFVLKERSQEVVTVLLRATRREQGLCQSNSALLATVCFFCGDEVSRRQFRSLLRSKPEAGRKLLSDNSLLKNVNFNEHFLGEEQVQEAFDLPQRPNDAQLFYSNMNKVILSVLGTMETSDSGESDCVESSRPSPRRGSESDSGFGNSDRHINISLDVLPVKGPQSPAMAPKEHAELPVSWTIQPEHLVLTAPTISNTADTKHLRIHNHSLRELSFELSWPAHCLTITPQHGTIEPESHLQILISPNPSLATKPSMLPWTGQVYVQCDNQQKFIKVQIRQDVALDVSVGASSPAPLSALSAQAGTPTAPGGGGPPDTPTRAHVEIKNRTLVFPATLAGETSESFLEVENGSSEVRWYLSSFAPPYVKGVDNSGDVYRATYTVFRCSRVSGILAVQEKMKIPISFLPRDSGNYAQFWDLECHPMAEPQQKSRVRFQLCGTGIKASAATSQTVSSSALTRTEAAGKARKKSEAPVIRTGQEEAQRRGVYAPQELYTFPVTRVGESNTLKANVRNSSFDTCELKFISPREPFHIKHSKYSLRSQHYINLPVQFRPTAPGKFSGLLLIQTGNSGSLTIHLMGEAVL